MDALLAFLTEVLYVRTRNGPGEEIWWTFTAIDPDGERWRTFKNLEKDSYRHYAPGCVR